MIVARLADPIIPSPPGGFAFLHGYQAINCLATIIRPYGTKSGVSLVGRSPSLPCALPEKRQHFVRVYSRPAAPKALRRRVHSRLIFLPLFARDYAFSSVWGYFRRAPASHPTFTSV